MLLQDFLDTVFRISDRQSNEEGIESRLSDLILAEVLGTLARTGHDGANTTVPIDTQGRVKKEDFLIVATALDAAVVALHRRAGLLQPEPPPS